MGPAGKDKGSSQTLIAESFVRQTRALRIKINPVFHGEQLHFLLFDSSIIYVSASLSHAHYSIRFTYLFKPISTLGAQAPDEGPGPFFSPGAAQSYVLVGGILQW